jgi:hypothetical protein
MTKQDKHGSSKAPGQFGNQGRPPRETRKRDAEERYQRNKEQAPRTEDPGADDGGGDAGRKKRIREVLR